MSALARVLVLAIGTITIVMVHPLSAQQGLGLEITISDLDNEQVHPGIAYNDTRDQYLVVWQNNWGGVSDIYAQRLDGEGNLLSWFTVDTGTNSRVQPTVTYDSVNDRYLVVWAYDFAGDGSDWAIDSWFLDNGKRPYVQRLDAWLEKAEKPFNPDAPHDES